MTLRIFGTGDNHFDERSDRWDHTLEVHERIAARVERDRPDLFADPGDLFERTSTPLERRKVRDFVRAVCRWCPMVITRGNHDPIGDLSSLLGKLRTDHPLFVVEDARVVRPLPGVDIAAVAWPSAAGAIDDGVARESLRDVLRKLGSEMAPSNYRVLTGHFDTIGAESGAGQPLIGGSLGVAPADLVLAGAQAVIMAHIHKAQVWQFGDVPILYTGSPVAHDFGETEEKSILDMRWDAVSGSFVYERIPTAARRMLLVSGRYDEATGQMVDLDLTTGNNIPVESLKDADIRLRYGVRAEHRGAAESVAEALADRWKTEGAHLVQIEPETMATVRVRAGAAEVGKAPTLADQLVALWTARGDIPARRDAILGKAAELAPR